MDWIFNLFGIVFWDYTFSIESNLIEWHISIDWNTERVSLTLYSIYYIKKYSIRFKNSLNFWKIEKIPQTNVLK